MPSFRVHEKLSRCVLCPLAFSATWVVAGGHLRWDEVTAIEFGAASMVALGTYAGNTFLSPDLDIPSTPYNSWKAIRFLWLPYQIMIGHRSPVSHWAVLGAVAQHVYLMFMVTLIAVGALCLWNWVLVPFTDLGPRWYGGQALSVTLMDIVRTVVSPLRHPAYWLFLLGQTIGSTAHCLQDWLHGKRYRHYQGQPMGPSSEDEEQAARGQSRKKERGIWER